MAKRNEKSSQLWEGEESPKIALLRSQLEFQYQLSKMNNARVMRICEAAGVTLEGLCATAGVFGKNAVRALQRNAEAREKKELERKNLRAKKPTHKRGAPIVMWKWPWPIALHFAKLEKFLYESKFMNPSPPGPEEEAVCG